MPDKLLGLLLEWTTVTLLLPRLAIKLPLKPRSVKGDAGNS